MFNRAPIRFASETLNALTPWGGARPVPDSAPTALGYRFTRHLQGKVQYSFAHENGPVQQGEQLLAAQLTIKF